MSRQYDVIVVGLGAMGSATAYQLGQRGKRVLGLERFTSPHTFGSSHGASRVIRQAYFEGAEYVPLLLRAYELWAQLERESNTRLLTITGGLMIGAAESVTVTGSAQSARVYGLPHELLDARDLQRRFPSLRPTPDVIALYEPNAGVLFPEKCIQAHLNQAAAHGAELHFEEPVLSWKAADGFVEVTTARGVYTAERLVLSPGAWAPELLAGLHLPLLVERQVLYWFDPVGGVEPFLPDRFPIYIWEIEGGMQFYGFPAIEGPAGGVKMGFFRKGEPCTPETINRLVSDEEVADMRAAMVDRIPGANGRLLHTVTCMYTTTPDEHFVIALHPQHQNVVIASPCSGHGFKFASVVGEIVADLALDGTTQHPIGLFDPRRFRHGTLTSHS